MGTICIQTIEVFERREPVLLVGHDADDGLWQLIATTGAGSAGRIGHLHHAVDEDPTLTDVLDLLPGHTADRARVGNPGHTTTGTEPERTGPVSALDAQDHVH